MCIYIPWRFIGDVVNFSRPRKPFYNIVEDYWMISHRRSGVRRRLVLSPLEFHYKLPPLCSGKGKNGSPEEAEGIWQRDGHKLLLWRPSGAWRRARRKKNTHIIHMYKKAYTEHTQRRQPVTDWVYRKTIISFRTSHLFFLRRPASA